ncbi:cytochrome c [Pantoea sp. Mb-10]|uniref:cytochrome c n=1 Tax=unclassified Pantoea TaxID=2630326 RepID=UPI001E60255C|nr:MULTISPECIES: cytochrome c [unclassified Pantoea]MCE0491903.1 cytochrome c [Pantoea sp. Mb-10]MCE0503359.1 cytochrome c [Pantoea sp. Pb-8]
MLKLKQLALSLLLIGGAARANDDALIKKGQYLAIASDCTACHTTEHGQPFAGGKAIDSPVGQIIATNITPSNTAGIGTYTEQQFADALRKGVRADGARLYPAMPYTAYATLTDEDVHALYAYFMSAVKPVDRVTEQTHLPFPLNLRVSLFFWNALFLKAPGYTPDATKSAAWNRGRYLVDGATHCSTCHTPRGMLMQEKPREAFTGAQVGAWYAPNITANATSGIGEWSQDDLVTYLKTGRLAGKAQAAGSMAEAITHSFQYLSEDDLAAIAEYMRSIGDSSAPASGSSRFQQGNAANSTAFRGAPLTFPDDHAGARLYSGNCASCHGTLAQGTKDAFYPSLFHNSATGAANPSNLIATILLGVQRHTAEGDVYMPPFGAQPNALNHLDDRQIATLSNWILHNYGNADVTVSPEQVAESRRGGPASSLVMFAQAGIAAGALLLAVLIIVVWRRRRR